MGVHRTLFETDCLSESRCRCRFVSRPVAGAFQDVTAVDRRVDRIRCRAGQSASSLPQEVLHRPHFDRSDVVVAHGERQSSTILSDSEKIEVLPLYLQANGL